MAMLVYPEKGYQCVCSYFDLMVVVFVVSCKRENVSILFRGSMSRIVRETRH